jgi:pyruvate dehydrogenase E1 component alpha subunit
VVAPYEFERKVVEGSDAGAMWSAFGGYLEKARAGQGPFLLECSTHRRSGHYEGDQQGYRDALQDSEWAQLDPIARMEALAKDQGWLDEDAARALTAEADAEVDRAVRFGRDSAPLTPEQAADLVYAT